MRHKQIHTFSSVLWSELSDTVYVKLPKFSHETDDIVLGTRKEVQDIFGNMKKLVYLQIYNKRDII